MSVLLHVTTSVAWLGAVGVFLALAVTGLVAGAEVLGRSAYAVMGVIGWWVIVPLCVASLVTGIVSAVCTPWGLIRYYWVIIKLLITVIATALLLLHMGPIDRIAHLATSADWSSTASPGLRVQLIVQSAAAVFALLLATGLSVYKPRGQTRFRRLRAADAREG